jgi:GTP-binding protein
MNPYVGVIEFQDQSRVTVADIPGLIEGAHLNKGLGHQFLKHIVKSRILAMVVDFSNPEPWEDIKVLWRELDLFQEGLADKCKLVIANKADLLDGPTLIARINDTKTNLSILYNIPAIEILPVSALHGLAVTKVTTRLGQLINT